MPAADDDFDVAFFPEGGTLLQDTYSRIAFKAVRADGLSTGVTGTIRDSDDRGIAAIRSTHLGMGNFLLMPEAGKSYHAVCTNEQGVTKRFELPQATGKGYALSCSWMNGRLHVSVLQPAGMPQQDNLWLVLHTRGIIQYIHKWNPGKKFETFAKDIFPSGVLQVLLLDANRTPLSERLVFVNNDDRARVAYQPDKNNYDYRSLVSNRVQLTN